MTVVGISRGTLNIASLGSCLLDADFSEGVEWGGMRPEASVSQVCLSGSSSGVWS